LAEIINLDVVSEAHSEGLTKTAAELKATRAEADKLGDSFDATTKDAFDFDEQIEHTRARVKALREEFATGGGSGLLGELKTQRSFLAELEKIRKEMDSESGNGLGVTLGSAAGTRAGQGFASGFVEQLSGLSGKAQPILIGALVGAAAAALPTVGAMLAGGVAGAFGTGAMAAGILSAAKDERVRSAAKQFGHDISAQFFGGGVAFVQPVLNALDTLRAGFADMHIGDALAKVAPTVEVIAQGLVDFGTNVMPGVNEALDRMGPFAKVAAEGFADMGDTLGDFLDEVTESRGSMEGLEALFRLVNGTVRILGVSLNFLSDRFHEWNFLQAKAFGATRDVASALGLDKASEGAGRLARMFERTVGIGGGMQGMFERIGKDGVDPFVNYLQEARQEMERLREETEAANQALNDYFHIVMNVDQAQLGVNKGLIELRKELKENGRHWEANTEAGIANREAVLQQIQNLERLREAEIAAGGDANKANGRFFEQTQQLLAIARQAGATKEFLEQLEREYVLKFVVYGAVTAGAQQIINDVRNLLHGGGASGSLPTTGGRPARESFAVGGTTPAFAPFEVHSGEILWSNQRHYVSTAAQTKALMAAGGGGGPVRAELSVQGSGDLAAVARALFPYFRIEVKGLGGAERAFN